MLHPVLLNNGDLIIHGFDTPLTKIDICSKEIWSLDYSFHHSTEKDDHSYWIPFTFYPSSVNHGMDEELGTSKKTFQTRV